MERKQVKDKTLTLRAQEIITRSDDPINITDALAQALRERGLSYEELLHLAVSNISTRSLRKSTYELPEQDGLFDVPSIICIGTPDGDLFLPRSGATVAQVAQWADEAQAHHATQNHRFKKFKKQLSRMADLDKNMLWIQARAQLEAGEN